MGRFIFVSFLGLLLFGVAQSVSSTKSVKLVTLPPSKIFRQRTKNRPNKRLLPTSANWERFDWKMQSIARNTGAGGCPDLEARTAENCPAATWRSRGNDEIHSVKIGSDMQVIKDVLNLLFQYGFSFGGSAVRSSGNGPASGDSGLVPATDYPTIVNRWHEFMARAEYVIHKNISLKLGYYFNSYSSKDRGVDIMKLWMGDVETPAGGPNFNSSIGRSFFLGDKGKGAYQAHIGFLGVGFKF